MQSVSERLDELDGHREDDGGVFLGGDLSQGLQVAQLERRLRLVDDVGRFFERTRRLHLALRRDHLYQQQQQPQDNRRCQSSPSVPCCFHVGQLTYTPRSSSSYAPSAPLLSQFEYRLMRLRASTIPGQHVQT